MDEGGVAVAAAAFGIAGPIVGRTVRTTNLPWVIDADEMQRSLEIPCVTLLNDLEAVAHGVLELDPSAFATLQSGASGASGNAVVVAAGTGLGVAGLYWDGSRHRPFASEGGHVGFGPETEQELELLRFMRERHGRVSWERVASGSAFADLLAFMEGWRGLKPGAAAADRLAAGEDAGVVVSSEAKAGGCELCAETLQLFVRLYGRHAGNLVLDHKATGGLYLGGGIPPKILDWLRGPDFLEALADKGRMRPLVESVPVRVVLDDRVPLHGAARVARATCPAERA
jgi:glucokinase